MKLSILVHFTLLAFTLLAIYGSPPLFAHGSSYAFELGCFLIILATACWCFSIWLLANLNGGVKP